MNSGSRDTNQKTIIRQASILRKNLQEWDYVLKTPAKAENWPTMLGRLNAAFNQAGNLDDGIEDVLEHFVYLPKKLTANPGDIPLFLSSKLAPVPGMESSVNDSETQTSKKRKLANDSSDKILSSDEDPVEKLQRYENKIASLATKFEENIVRY